MRQRKQAAEGWGQWLSELRDWDWFYTVTFREELHAKPRMVGEVKKWLGTVEKLSSAKVSWVLAEEWGSQNGRFHVHGLVSGVHKLRRRWFWGEAFRRFGRTDIQACQRSRCAAFYTAKYASKALGNIWLGGNGLDTTGSGVTELKLQ